MTRSDQSLRAPQQDRAIRTRRAILNAAGALFDERGYEGTAIADIVSRAGVTKGALYFHFPDKRALGLAVIEVQLDGMVPLPPQSLKTQQFLDMGYFLAYQLRTDPVQRGASRLTMRQGPIDLGQKRVMTLWIDAVAEVLTEAQKQDELLPSVNVNEVARCFVGAFAGVQNMSREFDGRVGLGRDLTVLWEITLPAIVRPAILAKLKFAPDRGEQIADSASSDS
ncbi:ScbR family autoregulator-binding transcription factor [Streptomyces sp. NPDC048644]|uniref:ScbR family autoregulator-binding transcription factor n=1 Tax=Streptomyces sp. NPDC048644 TaxID=3365582 RepID=UPI0037164086